MSPEGKQMNNKQHRGSQRAIPEESPFEANEEKLLEIIGSWKALESTAAAGGVRGEKIGIQTPN